MDADEIQAEVDAGLDASSLSTAASASDVTLRERWRRAMFFQHVDCLPNFEFGYWEATLKEWHAQGLPPEVNNEASAYAYFGIENWRNAPIDVMGLKPGFEHQVLEETEAYQTYRDSEGVTAQINKTGHKSIPHYIDFHLKDRASWEAYKEKLQAGPDRIPENWPELVAAFRKRDYPLSVPMGSMIGKPRNWIGFENIALMIYDDPKLLEEIVETLCDLVCDTLQRVLCDVEFDFGAGWEDICFNSGPIVGVDFMRSVVTPCYCRITDLLRRHGCLIAWTDCDGNLMPILDCLWEGGHTAIFPCEVNGGTDPVSVRGRYPDMRIQGGFCKMKLTEGKAAIRGELERLMPLVREGGFLPGVDHRVQADVPLTNYKYYLKLKRDLFQVGGTPQYDEGKIG